MPTESYQLNAEQIQELESRLETDFDFNPKHFLRIEIDQKTHTTIVKFEYQGDEHLIAKHLLIAIQDHPKLALAILSDLANDHLSQN